MSPPSPLPIILSPLRLKPPTSFKMPLILKFPSPSMVKVSSTFRVILPPSPSPTVELVICPPLVNCTLRALIFIFPLLPKPEVTLYTKASLPREKVPASTNKSPLFPLVPNSPWLEKPVGKSPVSVPIISTDSEARINTSPPFCAPKILLIIIDSSKTKILPAWKCRLPLPSPLTSTEEAWVKLRLPKFSISE